MSAIVVVMAATGGRGRRLEMCTSACWLCGDEFEVA